MKSWKEISFFSQQHEPICICDILLLIKASLLLLYSRFLSTREFQLCKNWCMLAVPLILFRQFLSVSAEWERARSPAFRQTAVWSAYEEKKLLFPSSLVECRLQKTNYSCSNPPNTIVVHQRERGWIFHSRPVFDQVPCPLQLLSRLWENSLCGRRTEPCNQKGQSPYLGHILISLLLSKIWLCCSFPCSGLDLCVPCHLWNEHSLV